MVLEPRGVQTLVLSKRKVGHFGSFPIFLFYLGTKAISQYLLWVLWSLNLPCYYLIKQDNWFNPIKYQFYDIFVSRFAICYRHSCFYYHSTCRRLAVHMMRSLYPIKNFPALEKWPKILGFEVYLEISKVKMMYLVKCNGNS